MKEWGYSSGNSVLWIGFPSNEDTHRAAQFLRRHQFWSEMGSWRRRLSWWADSRIKRQRTMCQSSPIITRILKGGLRTTIWSSNHGRGMVRIMNAWIDVRRGRRVPSIRNYAIWFRLERWLVTFCRNPFLILFASFIKHLSILQPTRWKDMPIESFLNNITNSRLVLEVPIRGGKQLRKNC